MKDIDQLYDWAISDHKNASISGSFLLSLWDGERYQVNLQQFLQGDENFYLATRTVLGHLYANNRQLADCLSGPKILQVIHIWGNPTCSSRHYSLTNSSTVVNLS